MSRKAYRLPFKLLGIPLDLDITFVLVLPLLAWMIANNVPAYIDTFGLDIDPEALQTSIHPFIIGLVAAAGLFASIVIHELGHCVVGRYFGMEITSITLWLLGGMAQFKEISKRPGVEALMAFAGPLTSYALGGLCWLALSAIPSTFPAIQFVVSYLMWMNVILATFNLIPALPLDGGRVLRSLLALRMNHGDATQAAVKVSRFFALLLGLVGLVSFNVFMLLIAFFVYMAGTSESELATVSAMLKGIRVRDVMTSAVKTVPPDMLVSVLIEKMFMEKHLAYPVLSHEGAVLGIVTLRELQHPGEASDGALGVDAVMVPVGAAKLDDSAFDVFKRIVQEPAGRLVVSGPEGKLEGIVSKTDLVQAVQLRLVGKSHAQAASRPVLAGAS